MEPKRGMMAAMALDEGVEPPSSKMDAKRRHLRSHIPFEQCRLQTLPGPGGPRRRIRIITLAPEIKIDTIARLPVLI